MRRKFLRLALLVSAFIVGGVVGPREASAVRGVCNYYCVDPELTCCITCYWMGGSCVCPEFCTIS
jgi:hypothetical protein